MSYEFKWTAEVREKDNNLIYNDLICEDLTYDDLIYDGLIYDDLIYSGWVSTRVLNGSSTRDTY